MNLLKTLILTFFVHLVLIKSQTASSNKVSQEENILRAITDGKVIEANSNNFSEALISALEKFQGSVEKIAINCKSWKESNKVKRSKSPILIKEVVVSNLNDFNSSCLDSLEFLRFKKLVLEGTQVKTKIGWEKLEKEYICSDLIKKIELAILYNSEDLEELEFNSLPCSSNGFISGDNALFDKVAKEGQENNLKNSRKEGAEQRKKKANSKVNNKTNSSTFTNQVTSRGSSNNSYNNNTKEALKLERTNEKHARISENLERIIKRGGGLRFLNENNESTQEINDIISVEEEERDASKLHIKSLAFNSNSFSNYNWFGMSEFVGIFADTISKFELKDNNYIDAETISSIVDLFSNQKCKNNPKNLIEIDLRGSMIQKDYLLYYSDFINEGKCIKFILDWTELVYLDK